MATPISPVPPVPPVSAPPPATVWPRITQLGLALLLGVVGVLLVLHALDRAPGRGRPSELVDPSASVYLIDLNQAEEGQLAQLPGIGAATAKRIVQHRQTRSFASIDELQEVRGIGPKTLERLRPLIVVGHDPVSEKDSSSDSSSSEPAQATSSGLKKSAPTSAIDLNRAGKEELMKLPGIGPALAERIIADRTSNGPYRAPEELTRVRGIKEKTLEKLLPYVRVNGHSADSDAATR